MERVAMRAALALILKSVTMDAVSADYVTMADRKSLTVNGLTRASVQPKDPTMENNYQRIAEAMALELCSYELNSDRGCDECPATRFCFGGVKFAFLELFMAAQAEALAELEGEK